MFMRRMLTLLLLGAIACLWPASSSHASPDSNRDGLIDVVDVQYVVGAILSPAGSGVTGADVDGDGVVDVADIQKVVNEILAVSRPLLAWSPTSGTQAWVGIPYSLQLQSSGGQPGHTWSLVSGSLPPGLSLSAAGVISGTPGPAGTFSFTVRVTDASSATHDRNITLVVGTPEPAAITSSAVTTGMKGVPYRYQVTASGQPAPTISVTGLPAWLTYSSATGLISGMPGVPQIGTTGTVTITAGNLLQPPATQSFSIAIAPQPVSKRTFDFNGDGYNDLVVGAPGINPPAQGAVFIFFGRSSSPAEIQAHQADVTVLGDYGVGFGNIVSSAGDINGDGVDDLLISAAELGNYEGRVYVLFGSLNPASVIDLTLNAADVTISGSGSGDFFGLWTCALGAFSGTNMSSFAIGSRGPPYNTSGSTSGRVSVFNGRSNWPATLTAASADLEIVGESLGSEFGTQISCAGDFNGDGKADMIVGAGRFELQAGAKQGRAYVFLGRNTGPQSISAANADVILTSSLAGAQFGRSLCGIRDLNGDGFGDVIVSRFTTSSTVPGESHTFVFFGSSAPPSTWSTNAASVVLSSGVVPSTTLGGAGLIVRNGSDLNGDGIDDLLLGGEAPVSSPTSPNGIGYVLLGRTTWPASMQMSSADITMLGSSSESLSGYLESCDFRGTGRPDLVVVIGPPSVGLANWRVGMVGAPLSVPSSIQVAGTFLRLSAGSSFVSNFGPGLAAK